MDRLVIAILGTAVLVAASVTADAKSGGSKGGNQTHRIDVSRVPVMTSTISSRPDLGVTPRIVPSKAVKNAIKRKIWCA